MRSGKNTFLKLLFLMGMLPFLSDHCFASRRTNNDVVTGKLLDPGPWDFFIFDTVDLSSTLNEEETDQRISENSREVSEEGEAKDAGVLNSFANANFDKFVIEYHRSRERFKKNFVSWLNRGKSGERPQFKIEDEKKYLQKALSSYRHLIFDFPKDKHTDSLYYRLSLILSLSQNDNTQIYLKKLFKTFPRSGLKDGALLLLANYMHYKNKSKSALKYYRKLFRSSDNKVRLYAKYMAAWIQHQQNPKNTQGFSKKLTEVVRISLIQDGSKFGDYMIGEALSDLVKIWDQPGYLAQAEDFFNRIQKSDYFLMTLERVAKRQIQLKKYPDAIKTYQKIISTSLIRPNNPQIHRTILELFRKSGNGRMIVATFKQMEKIYLTSSPWTEANKDHAKEASELMEMSLIKYAGYLTKNINPKDNKTLLYPIALLEMYLTWFKSSKVSLKIRLKLAQLLAKAGRHLEAGKNYKIVSDEVDDKSKLKYSGFVISLNEMKLAVWNKKTLLPESPHPLAEPALIPREVQSWVDMLEEFTKKYKENETDISMQDLLGDVYFAYGHYKRSEEVRGGIIKSHVESKFYPAAAMKQLAYYRLISDWATLNQFSYSLMASGKINDKKDIATILESLHKATFELSGQYILKNSAESAMNTLLKYQDTFPSAREADLALKKAYDLKGATTDIPGQLGLGNMFLKKYGGSPLLDGILLSMGDIYARILDPEKAALYLSYFVSKFPKDKRVADTVWKIAAYYQATGNTDKAVVTYLNFIKGFPSHPDVNTAFSALYELLRESDNSALLTQVSGQYINGSYRKIPVNLTLAKVYMGISRSQPIQPMVSMIAALQEADKKPAAEVLSQYLLQRLNAMVRIELSKEPDFSGDIRKMADERRAGYRALEEIGRQITLMGRADKVLEARYRLATLYSGFARKLSARIKEADEKMKIILENIAFESQEIAEKYFELINEIMAMVIAPESKTVFEGMVTYKKKFKVPREFVMKPFFTTLTTY